MITDTQPQLTCTLPQIHVTFGPTRRERFRVWLSNLRVLHIRIALFVLCRAMRKDPSFRDSWQANIAMPIYVGADFKLTPVEANKIADRLMKHLFDA